MASLIVGLLLVMISNVLLGSSIASLQCSFCKEKFLGGVVKVLCILLSCLFMYLCAILNPNLLVANIQGIDVNLIEAMELLFTSGIIFYTGKNLKKLKDLLQIDSSVQKGDK